MSKFRTVFFSLCALFFGLTTQASLPSDLYYNAGVVEFRPSMALTSESRVKDNLEGYLEILALKEAEPLDIVVFPESTLNDNDHATFVPNPSRAMMAPCDAEEGEQYHYVLQQLSCAARKYAKYLVINLTEKELCSEAAEDPRPCASNGLNVYNTNVVFDRQGAVISRYRKIHPYGENKNTTYLPELGWFDTDFGVRFGHFICFDILFYTPGQEMVDKQGIKDFIFPTMWFSQLPFLTAVQVHQAWSYGNDVNLLAAGASNPMVGSTGTGIYNGRNGILVAVMNQGLGKRTLHVSRVPKYANPKHMTKRSLSPAATSRLEKPDVRLKRDYLELYDTLIVDLSKGTHLSQKLCYSNSSLCCSFDLHWQPLSLNGDSQHYYYRLGAFSGLRKDTTDETNELMNCALISCIGTNDIMDCGKVYSINTDVIFENITIEARFPKTNGFLLMPNSLKASDLMPVPVGEFEWSEVLTKDNHIDVRYSLNTSTSNLLAFSIYGNYYDGDGLDDGASSLAISTLCGLISILVHFYI